VEAVADDRLAAGAEELAGADRDGADGAGPGGGRRHRMGIGVEG